MFMIEEKISFDDNIEDMYEEYLILVEGYPTQAQIDSYELEEWLLKEKIAEEKGGFADEYEIK